MSSVLAIVPARAGSKGIPHKNFRTLGGTPLWRLAVNCALDAGVWPVVSSDAPRPEEIENPKVWIERPAELAQDDTPMIDVVEHALQQMPGHDVIIVLQPTQPFRTPAHLQQAIALLQESGADSVVSVVELPRTHAPEFTLCVGPDGRLERSRPLATAYGYDLAGLPTRRQAVAPAYIRDGTVYCVRRKTVAGGDLYGQHVRPLIIDPADSCELDDESQWAEVERRWKEKHG